MTAKQIALNEVSLQKIIFTLNSSSNISTNSSPISRFVWNNLPDSPLSTLRDKRLYYLLRWLKYPKIRRTWQRGENQRHDLTQSRVIEYFPSIRCRWSSGMTLNRDRIIQIALNMFTKLGEIISATCTCIIPAAHGMHPDHTDALTPQAAGSCASPQILAYRDDWVCVCRATRRRRRDVRRNR